MVQVVFETPNGERIEIDAAEKTSMMQTAVNAGVPGIDADCGGSMVCGTCHVYVDPRFKNRLAPESSMERGLLDCVPRPHPDARLSCQIVVAPDIEGIVVRIPPAQR